MRTSRLINQRSSRMPAVCGRPRSRPPPRVAAAASPQRQARRTPRDRTFALFASLHRESSVDRTRRTRDARPASATPALHRAGHARPPQLSILHSHPPSHPCPPGPTTRTTFLRRRRAAEAAAALPRGASSSRRRSSRGFAASRCARGARLRVSPRNRAGSDDRRDDATTDGARKAAPFPRASPLRTSSLTALLLDRSPPSQR